MLFDFKIFTTLVSMNVMMKPSTVPVLLEGSNISPILHGFSTSMVVLERTGLSTNSASFVLSIINQQELSHCHKKSKALSGIERIKPISVTGKYLIEIHH